MNIDTWAPTVPTARDLTRALDYRDHNDLTADTLVVDAQAFTLELLAWTDYNCAINLRPGDVLTLLARLGVPVEQAEDEAAGYTEPDTGAFIGSRRPRYVGEWEEA